MEFQARAQHSTVINSDSVMPGLYATFAIADVNKQECGCQLSTNPSRVWSRSEVGKLFDPWATMGCKM